MSLDQPAHLLDLAGGRFALSPLGLLRLFRSRQAGLYLGIVLLALFAFNPHDLIPALPLPALIAIVASAMGLYILLFSAALLAVGMLQRSFDLPRMPTPILTIAAALPTGAYTELAGLLLTGGDPEASLAENLAFLCIVAEIFTLIFLRYVRPVAQADETSDESASQAMQEEPPERHILIGAEPVPLAKLIVIEAREHHVLVTLEGATLTQRARLGDIVAQTSPDDGLQPHRSWWVARSAAVALGTENGRPVLTLRDGQTVPVARARLPEVRDWLDSTG